MVEYDLSAVVVLDVLNERDAHVLLVREVRHHDFGIARN